MLFRTVLPPRMPPLPPLVAEPMPLLFGVAGPLPVLMRPRGVALLPRLVRLTPAGLLPREGRAMAYAIAFRGCRRPKITAGRIWYLVVETVVKARRGRAALGALLGWWRHGVLRRMGWSFL